MLEVFYSIVCDVSSWPGARGQWNFGRTSGNYSRASGNFNRFLRPVWDTAPRANGKKSRRCSLKFIVNNNRAFFMLFLMFLNMFTLITEYCICIIRVYCQSSSETLHKSRKRTRTFSGLFVRISTFTYCIPYILHVH